MENPNNPESILTQRPDLTVHVRADELLKYIKSETSYIGKEYLFNVAGTGYPMEMLAYTESINEEELQYRCKYLCKYLIDQGWLEVTQSNSIERAVVITIAEYARLARM